MKICALYALCFLFGNIIASFSFADEIIVPMAWSISLLALKVLIVDTVWKD
jgi:hypothetical protein